MLIVRSGGGGGATGAGENGKYFDHNVLERLAAGGEGIDLSHLFGDGVGDNGWFGGGGGAGARSNQSFGGTVQASIPSKGGGGVGGYRGEGLAYGSDPSDATSAMAHTGGGGGGAGGEGELGQASGSGTPVWSLSVTYWILTVMASAMLRKMWLAATRPMPVQRLGLPKIPVTWWRGTN